MSARPPLPRRAPPLPVRKSTIGLSNGNEKLASVIDVSTGKAPPPLPPRRESEDSLPVYPGPPKKNAVHRPPDLVRLLARRPPPPPVRAAPLVEKNINPEPPRRRLPPRPSTPPPPPTLNQQSKPQIAPVYITDPEPPSCLKCQDFSHVDAHAALFPRHTVSSLVTLAHELTDPLPSETEKARAIFMWLHHNIAYDTQSFFSGNLKFATPESTLSSGLAVCDGYAGLFVFLADCVGMQAQKVTGHGKGIGYTATDPDQPVPAMNSNHAWNCVLMDGEWRLIDPCWGAGAVNGSSYEKRLNNTWFTARSSEFGRRHFPEDPSYQLMSDQEGGPITWEDYILEPEGPLIYRDFYQLDLSPGTLEPATNGIPGGQNITFSVSKMCEHMSVSEDDNYVFLVSLEDSSHTPLCLGQDGRWSATVFVPRSGTVSLYYISSASGQDAKGLGLGGFYAQIAKQFGGLARWTIV